MENPFKWRHYRAEIILLCVRWYLCYALSYRDLEEMMTERGVEIVHTTIYRWVQTYAPEIDKRSRPHLRQTNDSWRVDETYVKVRGKWLYLYRAVDSTGQTLDFLLNETRSTRAAKRFFRKVLGRSNVTKPQVINVDQNKCYIGRSRNSKKKECCPRPVNDGQPSTSTILWSRIIASSNAGSSRDWALAHTRRLGTRSWATR